MKYVPRFFAVLLAIPAFSVLVLSLFLAEKDPVSAAIGVGVGVGALVIGGVLFDR